MRSRDAIAKCRCSTEFIPLVRVLTSLWFRKGRASTWFVDPGLVVIIG
jgi:hypothetical protein